MNNAALKAKAHKIFTEYTGIRIGKNHIVLLEADEDGSYIFFMVGKLSFAWYQILNIFCAYPNIKGFDGMKIEKQ